MNKKRLTCTVLALVFVLITMLTGFTSTSLAKKAAPDISKPVNLT